MSPQRVDLYWSRVFGIPAPDFLNSGTFLVPHARLEGFNGAWIFRRKTTCIVSVPPRLIEELRPQINGNFPRNLHRPQALKALFGDRIERVLGPYYQGCVDPGHFYPHPSALVRKITPDDRPTLRQLIDECPAAEWERTGLTGHDKTLFGCFLARRIVAVAGTIHWDPDTVNPGVITHPDFRGQGFGLAVVNAAVHHALTHDHLVLYQTLLANRPALRIADTLGFQDYARHLTLPFKSP